MTENSGDHYPAGNRFLQVSAERVVWSAWDKTYSFDVRTQTTSVVRSSFVDVHDDIEVLGEDRGIVLRVPGRAEERYLELESHFRLSPSGNYVLAVEATEERHAAAIVDTTTGELWRVPKNAFPWIAWSYSDIALVDTEDELLACDSARRECELSMPSARS